MYELIPDELRTLKNWVCWKAVPDPKAHSGISKIPINPLTYKPAQSNNPESWSDFDTAVRVSSDFAGIGFMFSGSGYFGVDIDDRQDILKQYLDGDENNIFGEFSNQLKTYMELSQSGTGTHLICRGKLPSGGRKSSKYNVEMYDSGRFFVMTGKICGKFSMISDGTEAIKSLHQKYFGQTVQSKTIPKVCTSASISNQDIIDKAMKSANGDKFRKLYNGDFSDYSSQSEADFAFCNLLAFWCGGDIQKMDEIFRSSGLMRDKWDRKTANSTYGKLTLQKAVSGCQQFYGQNTSNQNSYSVSIHQNAEQVREKTAGKMYRFDDTGNAERMFDSFGDILRYCYTDKKWLYYADGKWNYDNIGFHRKIADTVAVMLENDYPLYEGDEKLEKAFQKHLKKTRDYNGKTNMLKEYEHYSPVIPKMLDRNKSVMGCKNGILDLKDGKLYPHDKNAFITKQVPLNYNPNAPEPKLWLSFLNDIFGGNTELIRYIQKCVGYSLTGLTIEQCIFFLHGTGGNGKSVFLDIIRYIMGDYATNIQPQTIMTSQRTGNAPNSDIARLKGARLVTSVEPNEGVFLDEGLVKQLTGDDMVTARKMFAEEFEFKPEFKIWMATNHKPRIRGTDDGIWRRIHLIPFEVKIPEEKKDKNLKYKLVKEAEGIFKWAVEGCMLWRSEGLSKPKSVLDATTEYRHEMDVISSFIDECCTVGNGQIKASEIYGAYIKWAETNNEYRMSNTKFGMEMAKRFEKVKSCNANFFKGITVN